RKVARTAVRPVASGRISKKLAWGWLFVLCAIGLLVLLQLRPLAQGVALASVALVAAYPFMKRITWWPQAWLGMVFTWGLLVGWTQLRADHWDALAAMYAGAALWVIGYDTIYAMQDREDDALVGIRSSALRLGGHVQGGVALFYAGAVALWALAFWLYRADWVALLALLPAAAHLAWQVATLDGTDGANPLNRFRANRWTGALVAAACFVVG
ncbi:MAG: 4-hydroxybenzoate octaprenyltransferase, partial [Sphingomonadales bacterium]